MPGSGSRRLVPTTDRPLAAALIEALQSREVGIDRLFFDWRGGRDPGGEVYASQPFRALAARLEGARADPSHPYWSDRRTPVRCISRRSRRSGRRSTEHDDWEPFEAKIAAIRRMGEAMRADAPA